MNVTAIQISEKRQKVKTSDESIKMRKFISMTATMLKIGFIGFGGGSALIPVIEEEVVEKDKIVSEEEFNDDVMIASITPGALPVEVATGIGRQASGLKGMAAAATAIPSYKAVWPVSSTAASITAHTKAPPAQEAAALAAWHSVPP